MTDNSQQKTTTVGVVGNSDWHSNFNGVASMLGVSKSRLARMLIDVALPVILKRYKNHITPDRFEMAAKHVELMGKIDE